MGLEYTNYEIKEYKNDFKTVGVVQYIQLSNDIRKSIRKSLIIKHGKGNPISLRSYNSPSQHPNDKGAMVTSCEWVFTDGTTLRVP